MLLIILKQKMLINDLKKRKENKVSTNDDHDNFMN